MTEQTYIIFGLIALILILIIIMTLIVLKKKDTRHIDETRGRNQQELLSKIESMKIEVAKELELINSRNKGDIKDQLTLFKDTITNKVTEDMSQINEKVEKRLSDGFKTSKELFEELSSRLKVIDATQRNIEKLSLNVDELSHLLSDKKLRGMYGESQLYTILNNVFGEGNKNLYQSQYKLSNGYIVDAMIFGHDPVANIAIDSKFSLENYIVMNNKEAGQDERNLASKEFKQNIKKHIDDVASKYIIKDETANQAILFMPSEAVFAEVHAKYPDLIDHAQKKHVWITSPTTLVYMLTMIMVITSNVQREKNAEKMLKELENLFEDYKRFFTRFEDLKKTVDKLHKQTQDLDIPVNKLNKKVYQIHSVNTNEINDDDMIE